ncbi:MAG TPA: serine hydrolase domain-containing protein [Candidatus Aquilonibacter sp.]|nr:serine hydrolase domain-containing protein [Candidatus Aquilonibacter sp.]
MPTVLRRIPAICLIVLMSVLCAAQGPATKSPAERQLAAWLAAYNATDWSAYLAFLKTHFVTQPERGFQDPAFRDRTGGYDLKKIESETPTAVTALLAERAGDGFVRATLTVEPQQPHRILKLDVNLIPRPAEFALPHLVDQQLAAALRERLADETASDRFSGAVLVADQGKPILARAYGLADREHNVPNTLESRFALASMNKMFTAVALMQQVQAGKVALDDPLEKYLPDYPNKELAAKVTIAELLTNTGGTGDIWGPEFEQHRRQLHTTQDYIHLFGNRAPRFQPGTRWEYSNYGFILLGAVIEKVSGQSYSEYVHQHIFRRAGMNATSLGMDDTPTPNLSTGYTKMGSARWTAVTDTSTNGGSPAGGGYSTVGDLLRFANALRLDKLLDAQYMKLMTTGRVRNPFGFDAYGFGVQTINGNQCFGHNGSSRGVNGDFEMCLNSRYAVIVLANMDPPAAEQISEFIIARLATASPQ